MPSTNRSKRKAPPARPQVADPRLKIVPMRCSADEYKLIAQSANDAGLAIGGFLRSLALGSAGPRAVRRPFVDRVALARVLGEIGKLGSNVNQIARVANTSRQPPRVRELSLMQADIAAMRDALLRALDREG